MQCEIKTVLSDDIDGWCVIEKAEHENVTELRKAEYGHSLFLSSRISDADIEGDREEFTAMAEQIRDGGDGVHFRRCACERVATGYKFYSPRNSTTQPIVEFAYAENWAAQTLELLGKAGS